MKYKFFEHTADAKFQAYGRTMEEAFSNAALAMFSVITDHEKVKTKSEERVEVDGSDRQSLLYNFLEELLFLLDTKGFLLHEVRELKIMGHKLRAVLAGDTETGKYEIDGDVKAVTYNQMEISEEKGKCMVQVVVDI
jgi:SHS2 domain-containing protein